jgi:nucleotide-binding universal stress UspA family protein
MFKRILCATDGSEHGDRALRQAARMTRDSDGELHLAHVIERIPGGGRLRGQDVHLTEFEIDARIVRQAEELAEQSVTQQLLHETGRPVLALPPACVAQRRAARVPAMAVAG